MPCFEAPDLYIKNQTSVSSDSLNFLFIFSAAVPLQQPVCVAVALSNVVDTTCFAKLRLGGLKKKLDFFIFSPIPPKYSRKSTTYR